MLEFLKGTANAARTENGAAAYTTSCSDCLDLFAVIGALRRAQPDEITARFARAYAENPDLALKLLFFARDVREGLGERRTFRVILRWLAQNEPASAAKNVGYIAHYGRWDDLLALLDTPCEPAALACIRAQLAQDLAAMQKGEAVSLLAKWLPSVNTSSAQTVRAARRVARGLGMNEAGYRKTLVRLRAHLRLLENNLRERDYTFDYARQPSRALFKYRRAFLRSDGPRYLTFMERVAAGKEHLHTGASAPYDIIAPLLCFGRDVSEEERRAIDVTWRAQQDFTNGENALVVVDGSGSMYGGSAPLPAAVALSLGIYFAQRCTGAFHGHFITFSGSPRLVEIKGRDILEQVRYCEGFNECANTDLQKVFELILAAAVAGRVPAEEMPAALYIISDMEFDSCAQNADATHFAAARQLFAQHGYRLPRVVFWNVESRGRQQPVTQNEQGAVLVSGCTPRTFAMLQSGALSPLAYMMRVLSSERYRPIAA